MPSKKKSSKRKSSRKSKRSYKKKKKSRKSSRKSKRSYKKKSSKKKSSRKSKRSSRNYRMFSAEGNKKVASIVRSAKKHKNPEHYVTQQLHKLATNVKYKEAYDTAVRDAAINAL